MGWCYWYRDHGTKKGLAVEHYPDRKRPAICFVENNTYTILGYLKDEKSEKMFWKRIDELLEEQAREARKNALQEQGQTNS